MDATLSSTARGSTGRMLSLVFRSLALTKVPCTHRPSSFTCTPDKPQSKLQTARFRATDVGIVRWPRHWSLGFGAYLELGAWFLHRLSLPRLLFDVQLARAFEL